MARKLQRQLRDLREDYATAQQKETEVNSKKNELEKQLELAEAETVLAKNDLKLAMKRIEDLQTAINVELDSESDSLNRSLFFSVKWSPVKSGIKIATRLRYLSQTYHNWTSIRGIYVPRKLSTAI